MNHYNYETKYYKHHLPISLQIAFMHSATFMIRRLDSLRSLVVAQSDSRSANIPFLLLFLLPLAAALC